MRWLAAILRALRFFATQLTQPEALIYRRRWWNASRFVNSGRHRKTIISFVFELSVQSLAWQDQAAPMQISQRSKGPEGPMQRPTMPSRQMPA